MVRRLKDCLRDTLRKLKAVRNSENNVGQVHLHRRLFLLFYRAPARHEIARRAMNGTVFSPQFIV